MKEFFKSASLLLGCILLSRFILPPNITPLIAMAVFMPYLTSNRQLQMFLPVSIMFITDIFLGFYSTMWLTYGLMALIGVVSRVLNNGQYSTLMGSSVLSVVLWHLIINIPGPFPPLSPEALIFDLRLLASTVVFASVNPFDDKNADWEKREEEMIQLMKDRFGIGLASPQLGMGYRMFVMTFASGEDVGVFNPEILEFSKEEVAIEEGCLTFPLLYFIVTRPAKVKVRFQTHDQQVVEDWLEGMDARCFQHELDHLNGKLYLEYASDMKLKRAIKKRDKQFKILQNDLALQQLENGT